MSELCCTGKEVKREKYCLSCKTVFCDICAPSHALHETKSLQFIADTAKETLLSTKSRYSKEIAMVKEALQNAKASSNRITENGLKELKETIKKLEEVVIRRMQVEKSALESKLETASGMVKTGEDMDETSGWIAKMEECVKTENWKEIGKAFPE